MVNLYHALRKPFTAFNRALLGLIFAAIPILHFFALGYLMECVRDARERVLPKWTDLGKLFREGFVITIIQIIYSIPLIVVSALLLPTSTYQYSVGTKIFASLFEAITEFPYRGAVVLFIAIVTMYVVPAANARYAKQGTFKAAFDVKEMITTKTYALSWIQGVIIIVVLTYLLSALPWVGGAFAYFLGGIVLYTLIGGNVRG